VIVAEKQVQPTTYRSFATPVVQTTGSRAPVRTADNVLDVIHPGTGDKVQYVLKPFPTGPQP
jgi:hypothetical protein